MGTSHHTHGQGDHKIIHADHDHHHAHGHGHGHSHHLSQNSATGVKQLKRVIVLTLLFMVVEGVGGYYSNSLALVSDAVHMLTDTAALMLSLFAFFMSARPATDARTYGYFRLEILAAFVNGVCLVLLSLAIVWSAWSRYREPVDIKAVQMFWIALVGLAFNCFGAWLLFRSDHRNLNIRGALFHILGDALGSLGAMIAALLVYFFGWKQADPLVSIVIAIIIIASSFKLILDSVHVIIEGAPHHLNTEDIRRAIKNINLVQEVHDLHVWSITSGMVSLSVHVVADQGSRHEILCAIRDMLRKEFHIEHVTIQIEDESLKEGEPQI